jgi:hypothetical protein
MLVVALVSVVMQVSMRVLPRRALVRFALPTLVSVLVSMRLVQHRCPLPVWLLRLHRHHYYHCFPPEVVALILMSVLPEYRRLMLYMPDTRTG